MCFVDETVCVAIQQLNISRHDEETPIPEEHADKPRRKEKRKLMQADDLGVDDSKKQRTSELMDEENPCDVDSTPEVTADAVNAAIDQNDDTGVESFDVMSLNDASDAIVVSDEYNEYEIEVPEQADEDFHDAYSKAAVTPTSPDDTVSGNVIERECEAAVRSASSSLAFLCFETGFGERPAEPLHVTEADADVLDGKYSSPLDDRRPGLLKVNEISVQHGDKSRVDSETCAASEHVGHENVEKTAKCSDEPAGFPSADDVATSSSEILVDLLASEKVEDESELHEKGGQSDAVSDGISPLSEDAASAEHAASSLQPLKQADEPSWEICDVDPTVTGQEATDKLVSSQNLMLLAEEDVDSSSQSTIVSTKEGFPAAEPDIQMRILAVEAEVESAELCPSISSTDHRDVAPITDSELMSENDVDEHGDVGENLLPTRPADVTQSPAAGGSPGPVSQEATEKVDAGHSMMASTDGLEPSSLPTSSVHVSYSESCQTAEREVEMEAGSLSIEPEAESVKLCRSVSSSDQSSVEAVMEFEQTSESVVEKHAGDAEETLLPTPDHVTSATDDGVHHGSLAQEATEKLVSSQSLIPLTDEDVDSSSQSTIVSYTENFTEAERGMEMEGDTLNIAAEPENVKLCTSVFSDVAPVTDIEEVSGGVTEKHGDDEENLMPTSDDCEVLMAVTGAVDNDLSRGSPTHKTMETPLTKDFDSPSQSTIASYTGRCLTAEPDMQIEGDTLCIEAEAESAELLMSYSSVHERDVVPVTDSAEVAENVIEKNGEDAEEDLLPTSDDVTPAAAAAAADDVDDFEVKLL